MDEQHRRDVSGKVAGTEGQISKNEGSRTPRVDCAVCKTDREALTRATDAVSLYYCVERVVGRSRGWH